MIPVILTAAPAVRLTSVPIDCCITDAGTEKERD